MRCLSKEFSLEIGCRLHRLVEERILFGVPPGRGFIDIRPLLHRHLRGEQGDRLFQVGGAVAEVRAEGEINSVVHVRTPGSGSRAV
ncbi:MAG: hypothetical protein MZV64_00405 [Ignavibacteriales bacterium]|nr:hypothetical protein [Ignavibacteriales bacterium]